SVLASTGAFAAAFAIGRQRPYAPDSLFTLGVASGEPSSDGFVIWTRLAVNPLAPDGGGGMSAPLAVFWEGAAGDAMRDIILTGTVEANLRWAHAVHVEVGGLEPNRPYWYRFTAAGQQSTIGRARTAPSPDAKLDRLRFAFASCSNYQVGYFSAYRHIAEESPDLVIFLGDYIYENTYTGSNADRIVRKHDGPTATDLAGYRNRYALIRRHFNHLGRTALRFDRPDAAGEPARVLLRESASGLRVGRSFAATHGNTDAGHLGPARPQGNDVYT